MSSIWTVKPEETEPIPLKWTDPTGKEHDFWVRLKKYLSVGEDRRVMTAGWTGVKGMGRLSAQGPSEPTMVIDWGKQSFARAAEYLTAWSLKDDDGRLLKLDRETVEALHSDLFEIIDNAITNHVEEVAASKKSRGGETPS